MLFRHSRPRAGIQGRGVGTGGGLGFFTAFRMTVVARPPVILNAVKNPKPLHTYYVHILTSETHWLHVESENPGCVDLSAEWSEALDSSRSLP